MIIYKDAIESWKWSDWIRTRNLFSAHFDIHKLTHVQYDRIVWDYIFDKDICYEQLKWCVENNYTPTLLYDVDYRRDALRIGIKVDLRPEDQTFFILKFGVEDNSIQD